MTETPLFGKKLCNLLSNKIIQEFDLIDSNHFSEIYVINVNQFIIVKGKTSINNPINYSQLFKSYLLDLSKVENNFNVIDLIEYGSNVKVNFINLNLSLSNKSEFELFYLDKDIQGTYDIDLDKNLIFYSNIKLFNDLISNPEYREFDGIKITPNDIYMSDSLYGKSLSGSKVYEIYLKYISHNLFEKHLCKDINFSMFYYGELSELNYETMNFKIDSNTLITSKEWATSLILDLFDFNYKNIKNHLSLDSYDFSNEILSKDRCWMIRDKVGEMFLF